MEEETYLLFHFTAQIIGKQTSFDTKEILEVKWIPEADLKNMGEEEWRDGKVNQEILQCYQNGQIYPLEFLSPQKELLIY